MPAGRIYRSTGLSNRQVKQVQKIVNSNKDFKQRHFGANGNISTTQLLIPLTTVPIGSNFNNRESDRIRAVSLKGQVVVALNNTPLSQRNRIMVVRSKTGKLTVTDFPTLHNQPDLDKFQVLMDQIYISGDGDFTPEIFRFYKSFKNKKIPHMNIGYDNEANDVITNPIYLYMYGSSGTNGNTYNYAFNLKYYD